MPPFPTQPDVAAHVSPYGEYVTVDRRDASGSTRDGHRPAKQRAVAFATLTSVSHDLSSQRLGYRREDRHGMSLTWLRVLQTPSETSCGRLNMGRLATAAGLTRGGTTRLVDRLALAGHLTERPDPLDGCSSNAAITPVRQADLRQAWNTSAKTVDELITYRTDAQLTQLTGLPARLDPASSTVAEVDR